jgi:hypothetical protein
MLNCARGLEKRGIKLEVRSWASSDAELERLLRPNRVGTASNYCRLIERLFEYSDSHPNSRDCNLIFNSSFIKGWLEHLIDHKVGRYTPSSSLTSIRYFAALLEFPVTGDTVLLRNKCSQYKDEKSVETQRAKGYSKKFLSWLELMVLGSMGFTKPDQLVCGRIRLSAQASIRNDDLRRTPSGRIEWVYDPLEGEHREYRGILTRAQHTKTLPRHWACSRLGVTEQGDGWLEATVGLLAMAHGDGFATDDHLGKMALPSRHGWAQSPPDGPSDTCYIRRLMLEFSETLGSKDPRKFSPQEVIEFRCHGSKATLTSLATHLEIDRRWIRHQGAWKGDREDLMPDNYLRDTQRLSLRLQEKCMAHLREGGDMMELQTCPVAQTPNASANKPGLDGAKVKAKRPFVETLGFKHQIGVPTPSSTSSESDPEVPDDLVLDPEAEDAKFVAAKLFILNASTGSYHLIDFSESLLNPDKWTPLCGAKSSKDLVTLDSNSLCQDVLPGNGDCCPKCFPCADLDLYVAIPCTHICGHPCVDGICTNRCVVEVSICAFQGHACSYHRRAQDPEPSPKRIRKAVDKPASVCELPSGPSSSLWTLDASDAPPACVDQTYEDDFLLVEPLAPEPILPLTAA